MLSASGSLPVCPDVGYSASLPPELEAQAQELAGMAEKQDIGGLYPALGPDAPLSSIQNVKLPGLGDAKEDCGEVLGAVACPAHVERRTLLTVKCNNRNCPVCWRKAVTKSAKSALENIEGKAREQVRFYGNAKYGRIQQFILSPEPELVIDLLNRGGYELLIKEAAAVAQFRGVRGAVQVLHPWRRVSEAEKRGVEYDARTVVVGENGTEWYFSPHVHLIGCGFTPYSDGWDPSWLLKTVPRSLHGDKLREKLHYLLDHAGQAPGQNAFRYIGDFSAARCGLLSEDISTEERRCEECDGFMHHYPLEALDLQGDILPGCEDMVGYVAFVKHRFKTYRLKQPPPPPPEPSCLLCGAAGVKLEPAGTCSFACLDHTACAVRLGVE